MTEETGVIYFEALGSWQVARPYAFSLMLSALLS